MGNRNKVEDCPLSCLNNKNVPTLPYLAAMAHEGMCVGQVGLGQVGEAVQHQHRPVVQGRVDLH